MRGRYTYRITWAEIHERYSATLDYYRPTPN
jgi:hypothetical protein